MLLVERVGAVEVVAVLVGAGVQAINWPAVTRKIKDHRSIIYKLKVIKRLLKISVCLRLLGG